MTTIATIFRVLACAVRAGIDCWREVRRERRAVRELRAMDRGALRDLGIRPDQVEAYVAGHLPAQTPHRNRASRRLRLVVDNAQTPRRHRVV